MLRTEKLAIGYRSSKKKFDSLYQNIELQAINGELVALVGRNGSGKSTLLRTISGCQESGNGNVLYDNKNLNDYVPTELAKLLGYVNTEVINVENMSVFELVSLGRFPHTNWLGKLQPKDRKSIINAISMVGLTGYETKMVNNISDGERQRVMIARVLAQDTQYIILDEPTAFLDVANKYEILFLLRDLAAKTNKTIIFSTHDINVVLKLADRIWLMTPEKIFSGSPEDIVIQGIINKLFSSHKINFDEKLSDFVVEKKYKANVCLKVCKETNETLVLWTKKGLERIGVECVEEANQTIYLAPKSNSQNLGNWVFYDNETALSECNTIIELIEVCKKYFFR